MAYQNKAKLVSVEPIKHDKGDRIVVTYEPLAGPLKGKKDVKISAFAAKLSKESRALLKDSGEGDEIVLEVEKNGKYYNLVGVKDKIDIPKNNYGQQAKSFNDTGIKVGAARNQAIAFLSATKGSKFTLDDVDKVAYEIVDRQAKQEATINKKGENNAKTLQKEEKKESKHKQQKVEEIDSGESDSDDDDLFDDLDL